MTIIIVVVVAVVVIIIKFTLEQATNARRGSKGIALLFL